MNSQNLFEQNPIGKDLRGRQTGMRTKSYDPTPERKTFAEHGMSDLDDILSAGEIGKECTPI